jgi:hypothetical protein
MKSKRMIFVPVVMCGLLGLFAAAVAPAGNSEFIIHKVRSGETVSLLCIELYGHYTPEMGEVFLKENPSVGNINVILVGQQLSFHNPDYKAPVAPTPKDTGAGSSAASIFEKKLSITQAVVTYAEGDVSLISSGAASARKLAANTLVYPGDVIRTASNGRVELIINRETVVRIKENTNITLEALRDLKNNQGTTKVNFSIGSVWTKMRKFKDKLTRFQLELPTAIAGVHGTVYQTCIKPDSSSEVKVYDGEVSVSNVARKSLAASGAQEVSGPEEVPGPEEVSMEAWTQIVRSMQQLRIDKKGVPTKPAAFSKNPQDSWEQWNEERDKRIAQLFTEI